MRESSPPRGGGPVARQCRRRPARGAAVPETVAAEVLEDDAVEAARITHRTPRAERERDQGRASPRSAAATARGARETASTACTRSSRTAPTKDGAAHMTFMSSSSPREAPYRRRHERLPTLGAGGDRRRSSIASERTERGRGAGSVVPASCRRGGTRARRDGLVIAGTWAPKPRRSPGYDPRTELEPKRGIIELEPNVSRPNVSVNGSLSGPTGGCCP
jgi:hypothetical protein